MSDGSYEDLSQFLHSRYRSSPDLAQETLLRVIAKLESGVSVTGNIKAYAVGVAKKVRKEHQRGKAKQATAPDVPAAIGPEYPAIPLEVLDSLMKRVLSASERELLHAYFHDAKNPPAHRERLALRLGVSVTALYKRISRLKSRLELAYKAAGGREKQHA